MSIPSSSSSAPVDVDLLTAQFQELFQNPSEPVEAFVANSAMEVATSIPELQSEEALDAVASELVSTLQQQVAETPVLLATTWVLRAPMPFNTVGLFCVLFGSRNVPEALAQNQLKQMECDDGTVVFFGHSRLEIMLPFGPRVIMTPPGLLEVMVPSSVSKTLPASLLSEIAHASEVSIQEFLAIRPQLALEVTSEQLHQWDKQYESRGEEGRVPPAQPAYRSLFDPLCWTQATAPEPGSKLEDVFGRACLFFSVPPALVPTVRHCARLQSIASGCDTENKFLLFLLAEPKGTSALLSLEQKTVQVKRFFGNVYLDVAAVDLAIRRLLDETEPLDDLKAILMPRASNTTFTVTEDGQVQVVDTTLFDEGVEHEFEVVGFKEADDDDEEEKKARSEDTLLPPPPGPSTSPFEDAAVGPDPCP